MAFITVYITHPNEKCAKEISSALISDRLAACANIFPIQSQYWWKGEICSEGEWVSLIKSRAELFPKILARVKSLHPYEVPCIMQSNVEANEEYEDWIREQTREN